MELEPKNSAAHNDLGNVLLYEGDISAAIAQLEEALRLNPADALAQPNLQKPKPDSPSQSNLPEGIHGENPQPPPTNS